MTEVATGFTTKIVTEKNRIQTGRAAECDHGSSCRNYGGSDNGVCDGTCDGSDNRAYNKNCNGEKPHTNRESRKA